MLPRSVTTQTFSLIINSALTSLPAHTWLNASFLLANLSFLLQTQDCSFLSNPANHCVHLPALPPALQTISAAPPSLPMHGWRLTYKLLSLLNKFVNLIYFLSVSEPLPSLLHSYLQPRIPPLSYSPHSRESTFSKLSLMRKTGAWICVCFARNYSGEGRICNERK